MVRVVKPDGLIVVVDPDYATQVVDVPDQELARRVLRFRAEFGLRNGTLAHQMGWLFVQAGLSDVQVELVPIVLRDPAALDNALGLRDWAGFAHEQGLIEADEVHTWQAALDAAAANGSFLYSFSLFITAGRKPLRAPDPLRALRHGRSSAWRIASATRLRSASPPTGGVHGGTPQTHARPSVSPSWRGITCK
jgi:hypothetical protein